jgi:adenylosuccinate synthase
MKVDVLLGLQWGDEGKGKVVDVLTPKYDVVARFQGGPNAGHTLEFEGQKYVLRSIPSGIFQGDKVNIIGNGVVLDPALFKAEAEALEASGHNLKDRLHISKKAHLILPTHRILDQAYEAAKGDAKVGTTGKGIGPTYTDKVSRNGVRVGDILCDFKQKYESAKAKHERTLESLNYKYDLTELEQAWLEGIEYLKQFKFVDSEHEINNLLIQGKSILCEGAQGTMLDIDFGSYPFVTSSNTVCAGACTGLGVAPNKIGEVYGIFKAYCTRTKWGKYRPYLLWFAAPFAVCGVFLFTTPHLGETGKLIWAYVTYILMMTVYTGINVPYGSMLGVLTNDSDEKTVFSSFRMFFAYAGSFIALFAWEPLCL